MCIILNFIDYNIGFTRLLLPQILFTIHFKFIAYNKQTLQFCDALSASLSTGLAVDQSGCMAVAPGSSHWAVNGRSVPTSAYQSIQLQLLATGRLSIKVCRVSWNLDIAYFLMCMLSVMNAFKYTILKEPTSNS